jgi:hypothetical protein
VAGSVFSRTFKKAAELIGGREKLCRRLRVPSAELDLWIADKAEPPTSIFLKAVDLVIDEISPPTGSEPPEPPAPRDASQSTESSTWN